MSQDGRWIFPSCFFALYSSRLFFPAVFWSAAASWALQCETLNLLAWTYIPAPSASHQGIGFIDFPSELHKQQQQLPVSSIKTYLQDK